MEGEVEFIFEMNLDKPTCIRFYYYLTLSSGDASEGEQNMPPRNVPLWHVNWLKLKSTKTLPTQENLYLFLNYLKEFR